MTRNVLAVGAHPDDIELGCAGTLRRHRAAGDNVTMLVMTGGELGANAHRGRRKEAKAAAAILDTELILAPFFDGSIVLDAKTVNVVEEVILKKNIDTVYVHTPSDTHQDHVLVSRVTVAAARKVNTVLYYQSPSTVDFYPSIFVDVEAFLPDKLKALECHKSQVDGSITLDLEVVKSTAHYWGSRGRLGYAEPFEPHRFTWDLEVPTLDVARNVADDATGNGHTPNVDVHKLLPSTEEVPSPRKKQKEHFSSMTTFTSADRVAKELESS